MASFYLETSGAFKRYRHWIVRVVHLLVGVGAIGFADRLAGTVLTRRAESWRERMGVEPTHRRIAPVQQF